MTKGPAVACVSSVGPFL